MTGVIADPEAPSAHAVLHFTGAKNKSLCWGSSESIGTFDEKAGRMRLSLHQLAQPSPEVKDRANEQPEIVRELMALDEVWETSLHAQYWVVGIEYSLLS